MTVWDAWSEGLRRTLHAPAIVVAVWLLTLIVAVPLALLVGDALADHLGASLAAETAATGVNVDWWNEFLAQSSGLGQTFVPAILGFAAVLKNTSAIADASPMPAAIVLAMVAHLGLTVFVTGGVLDRLARDRAVGSHGFLVASSTYFVRLLRLSIAALLVYWLLFTSLHPWLFESMYPSLTRDVTVERTAFAYRLALYGVFGGALLLVNVLFDYAKIRMIVEDRRSAIGALAASLRFITRHRGATLGLYALNTVAFLIVVGAYALLAPSIGDAVRAWLTLAVGQLFIVCRIVVRLMFAASQIALFQSRLAHAGYTAAAPPKWPDSPAADAILPR
jgi:hypothetical protein